MKTLILLMLISLATISYRCGQSRHRMPESLHVPLAEQPREVAQEAPASTPTYSLRPYVQLPYLGEEFYDRLANGKTIRNPQYFGMRGPVKSLGEIEYPFTTDTANRYVHANLKLRFSEAGRLIHLMEGDTSKMGRSKSEHYYYYDSLNALRRVRARSWLWGAVTLLISEYDRNGYLTKETHRFRDNSEEPTHYHYRVLYTYSPGYTEVKPKAVPISGDYSDEWVPKQAQFQYNQRGEYLRPGIRQMQLDSLNRPLTYFIDHGCGRNMGTCVCVDLQYDKRGNITEMVVDDQTVRNSFHNESRHTTIRYNEYDLPVEMETFGRMPIHSQNWHHGTITYAYTYDEQGNWTSRTEHRGGKLTARTERQITYYGSDIP